MNGDSLPSRASPAGRADSNCNFRGARSTDSALLSGGEPGDGNLGSENSLRDGTSHQEEGNSEENEGKRELEKRVVRKVDLRLCTIAGILCSLNLLDSGIISSASVTSIFEDLDLGVGNRYVSLFPSALACAMLSGRC